MKGKHLITTDQFFIAPDGMEYRAAWGNVEIVNDSVLGLQTNRNSTNWFAKVGSDDKHIIIAGCQIHYAIRCEEKPNTECGVTWDHDVEKITVHKTPSKIYIAE